MEINSKLILDAVDQFAMLPGIGRKTALRLTMYLLRQPEETVRLFGSSFIQMREQIRFCHICNNISDGAECNICLNPNRDKKTICVVEDIQDIISIEQTSAFKGLYHVLGGVISPIDGIGPQELALDHLFRRVTEEGCKELLLALPTTMEGETTSFYIYRQMQKTERPPDITVLARGIAIGDNLEFTDEVTLGRSIVNRTPYESALSK